MRKIKGAGPAAACLAAALAAAACSRKAPSFPGAVTYASPTGEFSCAIPGDWRVLENEGGSKVSFFGPPGGAHANSASIAIYRYARTDFSDPEDYYRRETVAASSSVPMIQEDVGESGGAYYFSMESSRPVLNSRKMERIREEDYLISAKDGFYALVYMCPDDAVTESEGVFRDVVQSFKPSR
ncbi:MAG: hypothetical protein KGL04_11150 [Elusimicrobia bacterium]|nr:hypothetical protein [Elusimicrobiota bacterium]MDE2314717.1 hypothetical protein [Elusimicrobiota bacterium]